MKASGLATEQLGTLVEFIYEYPRLTFDKEDFVKRKRVKNTIPITNRCAAKRANGEQCTRKKKDDCDFCGTHYKSAPHGLMVCQEIEKKKTEIYTEDINGIIYYVDDNQNVYKSMKSFKTMKIRPLLLNMSAVKMGNVRFLNSTK